MNSVPLAPTQRLIHDVTGDLSVVVAASQHGYRDTALEACLLAKEKLQAIREELLRPELGIADSRFDYDGSSNEEMSKRGFVTPHKARGHQIGTRFCANQYPFITLPNSLGRERAT